MEGNREKQKVVHLAKITFIMEWPTYEPRTVMPWEIGTGEVVQQGARRKQRRFAPSPRLGPIQGKAMVLKNGEKGGEWVAVPMRWPSSRYQTPHRACCRAVSTTGSVPTEKRVGPNDSPCCAPWEDSITPELV